MIFELFLRLGFGVEILYLYIFYLFLHQILRVNNSFVLTVNSRPSNRMVFTTNIKDCRLEDRL